MLPTLQIGPLAIQTPGLILLIGIWFALDLADRQAPLFEQNGNRIFTLLIFILAGGLVGARLVFAAEKNNPPGRLIRVGLNENRPSGLSVKICIFPAA